MDYLNRLRTLLSYRGERLITLAEKLGMSENQLLYYLVDGQTPSPELDARISQAVGLEPGTLNSDRANEIDLAQSEAKSCARLYLKAGWESASLLLVVFLPAAFLAFLFAGLGALLSESSGPDVPGILYLVVAVGLVIFAIFFTLARYPVRTWFTSGPVRCRVRLERLVVTHPFDSQEIALDDLVARLQETSEAFIVTSDRGRMICIPKAGFTPEQLSLARATLLRAAGDYTCTVHPGRRLGLTSYEERGRAAKTYHDRLGWQILWIAAALIILSIGVMVLMSELAPQAWAPAFSLIGLGLVTLAGSIWWLARNWFRVSWVGWVGIGLIGLVLVLVAVFMILVALGI